MIQKVFVRDLVIPQELMASRLICDLDPLKEKIRKKGMIGHLIARPMRNHLELMDGVKRWICLFQLKIQTVDCDIRIFTQEMAEEFHLINSHQSIPTKPKEYKQALLRLMNKMPELTVAEFAQRIQLPISELLRFLWVKE